MAKAWPMASVPSFTVVAAVYALEAERRSAPAPDFVRPKPVPSIRPPTVSVEEVTVTVGVTPSVTVPVPRLSELEPRNVKPLFQVCGLLLAIVRAAVTSRAPPRIVSRLVAPPRAALLSSESVPAESVRPPVKMLVPESVSRPAPPFTRPPMPLITPPTIEASALANSSVPAFVIVLEVPVPKRRPPGPITRRLPAVMFVLPE
jgi:hypothetical protein